MKKILTGLFIILLSFAHSVYAADDFFDGLIVSEEMKKEELGQSGTEQARKLLESKPTVLKVQNKKVRFKEAAPEEAAPIIRAPAPFGLKWLATVDEIKYLSVRLRPIEIKDNPHSYVLTNLPNPVSAFREVTASFGDNDSLWRITAYGKMINDTDTASKGVAEYNKYYRLLNQKYGNGQQFFTPAVINVDEVLTAEDGTQSTVSHSNEIEIGGKGFLSKLVSGESSLYSTFDNGKVGVTLALIADGNNQTYIVIDYKNLSATKKENDELYEAL